MSAATCQYIKIFVVRPCVTDVGVAGTNLRVVCKIITCVSAFTEIGIFLEIVRGHLQTIFGKINVIVTLWGEGVIGHDV